MGDQLISYHKERNTPEQFPYPALHKSKHSPEKKTPIEMFNNRYNEYVKQFDKTFPAYLFEIPGYKKQDGIKSIPTDFFKNCEALKLSTIFTKMSRSNTAVSEENFIHSCIDCIEESGILKHIDDIELLIIYIDQLRAVLKESGITESDESHAKSYQCRNSYSSRYVILFSAFWNKIKWEDIFLSMPEFAAKLQANKEAMIGIILKKKGQFRLDTAANEFLSSTGLGRENDLYLISFLDFYFFTWLSHFGLINYLEGSDNEPVMVEVTRPGRKLLELL
jgi:hypothetical protein